MVTSCLKCPLRGRPIFAPMNKSEATYMDTFKSGELQVEPGTTLLLEGSNSPQLYTALSGMGLRYKTLESGKRQVVNFVFPGDFLGLQAGVMKEMKHSVEATTAMTLCVFDRKQLWTLFRDYPERAFDLTWLAAVEEHFLGESLAALGQMSALERVARALVSLYDRADALDLVAGSAMPFPYTQQDLADALGLSLVHTNRTLKQLREKQAARWQAGKIWIDDYGALCGLAKIDADQEVLTRPLI